MVLIFSVKLPKIRKKPCIHETLEAFLQKKSYSLSSSSEIVKYEKWLSFWDITWKIELRNSTTKYNLSNIIHISIYTIYFVIYRNRLTNEEKYLKTYCRANTNWKRWLLHVQFSYFHHTSYLEYMAYKMFLESFTILM